MAYTKTEGVMRRERNNLFLLFMVCLVAAMPLTWGAGGLKVLNLVESASVTDGVDKGLSAKETLCHTADAQTIMVGEAAVAAHLAHGDSLGACPQACAGVPSAVPKTGQTGCWDANGAPIDCAGTGQDGELQRGVSVSPRFTDNADGTVKDNLTGLIWLKNANCFGSQTWTDALTASNTLASGSCGLTDGSVAGAWRLPNVRELESLIDFGQLFPSLSPGHPFTEVQPNDYWSSTTSVFLPNYAWIVTLDGGTFNLDKTWSNWVWPVRGGR